ncbi:MAG: OmpH family outer membrane protein [Bacteroidetes bacterium]|nr:OmpH family outer membrane protein [Bacteroidota bacterium]MBP6402575.1 OmpH family outer membrane protein [Bacteroidia bacterium]MBK6836937.1 OmpH family outer membrane protein [Bacteroidota bacterium]MBK9541406.1 OmpH family outer membrane protein [Bacteroidota bacterium]MBL0258718.1 OmpH family outer membrane protein [Bacteroidota bacterium]
MKKSLVLALVAVLMTGITAFAQTLKFGHIDSGQLIQMMPQTKQADSALKKFGESLDSQLKGMTVEYQTKLQSYQSKADSMPEAIRTTKEKELTDLGNRIQDFQQTAQESIQKKKEELYGPILKKAEDAIKDIAKEKAYSYIFDTSLGSVIFAQESDNIMPLVKTRLGIK